MLLNITESESPRLLDIPRVYKYYTILPILHNIRHLIFINVSNTFSKITLAFNIDNNLILPNITRILPVAAAADGALGCGPGGALP